MTKEEMAAKVKRIKEQIIFLNKAIEKTMNLTQLESGKMKITRGSVELNRFLGIMIMEITMSPDHNHKIIFHKTDMPLIINTDTLILKEIINNLLTNSMKYSKPEDPVEVRLTKNEKYAIIEDSDKGIGVPDEDKDAVFEAFHRGSNVGGIRGTGLGLAISKRFVKTLGGKVYFESELNKGTKFFVLLPVREG
jgi:K+-sensing histidine kinase KdpD